MMRHRGQILQISQAAPAFPSKQAVLLFLAVLLLLPSCRDSENSSELDRNKSLPEGTNSPHRSLDSTLASYGEKLLQDELDASWLKHDDKLYTITSVESSKSLVEFGGTIHYSFQDRPLSQNDRDQNITQKGVAMLSFRGTKRARLGTQHNFSIAPWSVPVEASADRQIEVYAQNGTLWGYADLWGSDRPSTYLVRRALGAKAPQLLDGGALEAWHALDRHVAAHSERMDGSIFFLTHDITDPVVVELRGGGFALDSIEEQPLSALDGANGYEFRGAYSTSYFGYVRRGSLEIDIQPTQDHSLKWGNWEEIHSSDDFSIEKQRGTYSFSYGVFFDIFEPIKEFEREWSISTKFSIVDTVKKRGWTPVNLPPKTVDASSIPLP